MRRNAAYRAVHRHVTALPPLPHVNIDIEIDIADAGLPGAVRAAFVPRAAAGAGVSHIGQFQAAPLRQFAAAFAGELPRQHDLFAALVDADDVGTQFAGAAVLAAHDLLLAQDGVAEQGVGVASHRADRLPSGIAGQF